MSRTNFSIAYGGPAVDSGAMDVRDLAPALLALGQLFDAANSSLNEERTKTSVNVQATNHGSFEVGLEVVQKLVPHVVDFFSGEEVTAALQLKELIFGTAAGVGGVVWLIKRIRNRKLEKLENIDGDRVRITFNDGTTIEADHQVLRLYENPSITNALSRIVKDPLDKEGMETFEVRQDGDPVQSVSKQESEYFTKPEAPDEVLVDETKTSSYSIDSLAFKENNKWRLYDGNAPISATIMDEDFLQKVNASQISFSKGDLLICKVRTIQTYSRGSLKTEYEVRQVIEHRSGMHQMEMPFNSSDSTEPEET